MTAHMTLTLPTPSEFVTLRRDTSWGAINLDQATAALKGSLCGVTLRMQHQTIGMVRVVGDGVLNLYLQDVIVSNIHRGQGHGRALLDAIIRYLQTQYPPTTSVGLMAAYGQDGFYARFGFTARPTENFGPGMQTQLSDLRVSHLANRAAGA